MSEIEDALAVESDAAMKARVQASFDRQGMMATLGVDVLSVEPLTATYTVNMLAPAAGQRFEITGEVIGATMSVLHNRPGISG